jgi:hypothetical protein
VKRSVQIAGVVAATLVLGIGAGFILGRHSSTAPQAAAHSNPASSPSQTRSIQSTQPVASTVLPVVAFSSAPSLTGAPATHMPSPTPSPSPARSNAPARVLPSQTPTRQAPTHAPPAAKHTASTSPKPTPTASATPSVTASPTVSAALTWYTSETEPVQQLRASIAQVGGFAGLKAELGDVTAADLTPYIAQAANLGGQMQAIEDAAPAWPMHVALAEYVTAANNIGAGISDYLSGDSLAGGLALGLVDVTLDQGDQDWSAARPAN